MTTDGTPASTRIRELEEEVAELKAKLASTRRVGLVWEDRKEKVEQDLATYLPALTHMPSRDVSKVGAQAPPHLLIEGDNLHALTALQYTHKGKVDVIYIDPPYNTGREDFRYNDCWVGKDDEWRHSAWLSFMDKRIRLAKELLADGGFLAVSIDDHEMAHLKLLLDQHFGEGSVKTVVVKMSELASVKMGSALPKIKEYLLIARPGGVGDLKITPVPKLKWDAPYNQYMEGLTADVRARIIEIRERGSVTKLEAEQLEQDLADVTLMGIRVAATRAGVDPKSIAFEKWRLDNAWRIARTTNGGGSITRLVRSREAAEGLPDQAVVPVVTPRNRLYLALTRNAQTLLLADDYLTTIPGDIWTDITTTGIAKEGGVLFKNGKKPLALLRRIIDLHPNKDAVVLDFFAGSGTTAHAVAQLNKGDGGARQCILITNDENEICTKVTLPRVRGVLTGKLANGDKAPALPGSLRYYRCELLSVTGGRDAVLRRLAGPASDMIAVRENSHELAGVKQGRWYALTGGGRSVVVWCAWSTDGIDEVLTAHPGEEQVLYLFGLGDLPDPEVVAAHPGWRVEVLPEPLRAALTKAHQRSMR